MIGDFDLVRLYRAGGYAGLALAIEHVICYDPEEHTKSPELVLALSNILGVTTLTIAYGYAKRSWRAALEFFTIALIAGSIVIGIRYGRRIQRVDRTVNFLAGRITERIEEVQRDEDYARNGRAHTRA